MTDSPTLDHAPNQPVVAAQSAIPADELQRLTDDIVAALKTVYDPEIPSDIYELGLIYNIDIDDERSVAIEQRVAIAADLVALREGSALGRLIGVVAGDGQIG